MAKHSPKVEPKFQKYVIVEGEGKSHKEEVTVLKIGAFRCIFIVLIAAFN